MMAANVGRLPAPRAPVLQRVPCQGTIDPSVRFRPGQLALRPEAQGAVQEVTNGLKPQ